MFTSLLIANRGEIACRIIRTARRMGLRTIAIYSGVDRHALHVREADEAVLVGPDDAASGYLDIDAIMEAVRATGAEALHPGYGFLSENQELAAACARDGVIFVGPSVQSMRLMGRKDEAKRIMEAAGVPVTPGYHGEDQRDETLVIEAEKIGYPVLIKAVAGGGGRGMRRVDAPGDFLPMLESARREAKAAFGDDTVLLEKYIRNPRHVEVQIFGDRRGRFAHFYERDCSIQRRHQKVIEESPAPGMDAAMRSCICAAAVNAARAVAYENAGTVEFIVDGSGPLRPDGFWFMEMNTRLQVEHPVSEAVTGYDLVELQLKIAAGGSVPEQDQIYLRGHAIEARIYAEDPANGFLPSSGTLAHFVLPGEKHVRVDTGYCQDDQVSTHFDPMLAKIIAHAPTRKLAIARLTKALGQTQSWPVRINAGFLNRIVHTPDFAAGCIDTGFIENHQELLHGPLQSPCAKAAITALVAQAEADQASAPATPWQAQDGWRLNQAPVLVRAYMLDGETCAVRLQRTGKAAFVLCCGDVELSISKLHREGKSLHFICNGIAHEAQNITCNGGIVTFDNGDAWQVFLPSPEAALAESDASTGLRAPLPGKVLSVNAKAGGNAAKGEVLVVIEAMKMEHALSPAADAVIADVLVKPGAQVAEGEELVRFEQASEKP